MLLNRDVINNTSAAMCERVRRRPPIFLAGARCRGQPQKLIVAREFDIKPRLLLVAQPLAGVDIGGYGVYSSQLIELRDAGAAGLLVSAELDENSELSDRSDCSL